MNRKGFTLIELIVVVAIIAILALILIPSVTGFITNAQETTLTANTKSVMTMISLEAVEYEKSDWYDSWRNDGDGSLNNHIENIWENGGAGTYGNDRGIVNPVSGSGGVVDYYYTINKNNGEYATGYRPALYMTSNPSYSYAGSGSLNNLYGSIVAFFYTEADSEYIEFYYVNQDGVKSDFHQRIS